MGEGAGAGSKWREANCLLLRTIREAANAVEEKQVLGNMTCE
jgi:hypothetical protein